MFTDPISFWIYLALNLTTLLIMLKSATLISSGSLTIMKVTPSAQGGVVREPEYWSTSEDATLARTSVKSIPAGMAVLVPGVLMADMLDDKDFIMDEDSPAETWNIRATTAIWVGSARVVVLDVVHGWGCGVEC
jgi:hypothetical protein